MSGFGFNDDHLSEPILSAIQSNPSLKLILTDHRCIEHLHNQGFHGSSVYWKKFSDLASKGFDIHFIAGSFADVVNLIPSLQAMSPAEQLANAIRRLGGGVTDDSLSEGLLQNSLRVGVVSSITANGVKVNLAHAGEVSGQYLRSHRYGRGEVGELVLIEAQQTMLLGRVTEVSLPDRDWEEITQDFGGTAKIDAIGVIRLLGSVHPVSLRVQAGISAYPRLGDRVFSAPGDFVSRIPRLTGGGIDETPPKVTLCLGVVSGDGGFPIAVTPEKLFGRHCAILGSTGGGKS
ncbi:Bipolar DNA helicase HerA [Candidatus Burkholderia humilis]|nr:Bipolar DNA helicase HerA [Candidatus Burkholderia humilis]